MRELADAGHHDARGVRQLGPQHHRVPVRRRRRRRAVRRHAVRRGADALPAAASAQLVAAAQVQDRVRRLRRRSRRRRRSTTSAGTRASRSSTARRCAASTSPSPAARRPWCGPATCCSSSCRPARCSTCAEAIIRVFHRLGDYKHKQRNRLKFLVKTLGWDALPGRVRDASSTRSAADGGAGAAVRSRRAAGRSAPRRRRHATCRRSTEIARAPPRRTVDRPRHRAAGRAAASRAGRRVRATGDAPTSGRRSRSGYSIVIVATLLGDLTSAQMRLLGDLASSLRRRHGAGHRRSESGVPLGAQHGDVEALYRSLRGRRPVAAAAPGRCRTSRAARAPSRASSP